MKRWTAGIFQTPQLLELSGKCLAGHPKRLSLKSYYDYPGLGIGRQPILNKFGIDQVLELPVGENLRRFFYISFHARELSDRNIVFADATVVSQR